MQINYLGDDKIEIIKMTNFDQEKIKDVLLSPNNIKEINCFNLDTSNLEYLKYLIELSPFCKDELIKKNIYGTITTSFIKDKYSYPDTWNTTYKIIGNNFYLTSLITYKKYVAKLHDILIYLIKEKASPFEIIKVLYDEVKSLPKVKSTNELEAFIKGTLSLNETLAFLLKTIGMNATIVDDYTLVYIDDNKYNLKGIYIFKPELDRNKFSYQGFCFPLEKTKGKVIESFLNRDITYLKRNIHEYNLDIKDYLNLYRDIFNTRKINEDNRLKCINNFKDIPLFSNNNYQALIEAYNKY